jgi:hypothetical protein
VLTGIWFLSYAMYLGVVMAALVFTVAVRRSQALRSPTPQFQDFGEEEEEDQEED